MDFNEIADRAYRRIGPDKFYNLPQNFAYYQLQELYYNYKIGNISKENSIIKKKQIQKDYEWNQKQYENCLKVYQEYNRNRVENTLLLAALEKSKSKDEALINSFKIIANYIDDDSFVERMKNKMNLN